MSANNHRKCSKCGRTRSEDLTVTYHRFPNPGTSNATKARAWAKYCWPNEDWSIESLASLHNSSKVLCGRHFSSSQFYDNKRQKLSKFAVPYARQFDEVLNEQENVSNVNEQLTCAGREQPTRVPLSSIENIDPSVAHIPSTSGILNTQHNSMNSVDELPCSKQNEQLTCAGREQPTRVPLSSIENIDPSVAHIPSTSGILNTQHTSMNSVDELPCSKQNEQVLPLQNKSPSAPKGSKGILKSLNILKSQEMTPRELKLYKICKNKLRQIARLRKIIKKKKNAVKTLSEDENIQKLCDMKISSSFLVLLQSQLKNCPKKPKGRRYTLKQKIMALVIYKKSPACYRLLRRLFALPCQSSLNKLLNRVPLKPGINKHIFESLKQMSIKQLKEDNEEYNICILSFDEMSIRKHFAYDPKTDEVKGFQDLGNYGRENIIATKALVFMLSGIRKKWKQPIAYYLSHSLKADRMAVILKEILTECFNANINVVATVCDMSTVNVKVLKLLGATTTQPFLKHNDRQVVAIFDPPHLLKCTRNLFIKHNVQCKSELQTIGGNEKGLAKWAHIEAFYNCDKNNSNFVFAPALSEQHLNPNIKQKMKVKLAAQVFSHSVSAGILAKIATNELPSEAHVTATFTHKFDQLFDAVNADTADLRGGKKYSTNLTPRSPHIELFVEMKKFISNMKYVGSAVDPPSQNGWLHTINAIEHLWQNLQSSGIKSLSTRRLNQDPLENCFGCIRYSSGSNNNPTVQQFVAGLKTAIVSNLKYSGLKKNCEDDTCTLSNNLINFIMAVDQSPKADKTPNMISEVDIESIYCDAVEATEMATPESQACAYVCGFIIKKIRNTECLNCRKAFLSENNEAAHTFISFKEYSDTIKSLQYANKNMIVCVETMATIINNFLRTDAWTPNIKVKIMNVLQNVNFDFLNKCEEHLEVNVNHLKISTFCIVMKRFIILKNREMEEDDKKKAVERKIKILKNN